MSRDSLEMHQACRDAVLLWWEQREDRAAVAGARLPVPSRPWPRFVPGKRADVRVCTWGPATYVAARVPTAEAEAGGDPWAHEWIVYRTTPRIPMRRWTTTPSLTFILPAIARMG